MLKPYLLVGNEAWVMLSGLPASRTEIALMIRYTSKRSNLLVFRYYFNNAWMPSTREVTTLPKCVCWSTQALTSFFLYS